MGGDHIAHLDKNSVLPGSGVYYQQFIEGKSFSALFLANGRQACVLGFSELWHSDEFPDTPFKYGGAISLSTSPEMFAYGIQDLPDTICRLVAASGLKGLCGLDFILDRQNRFHILEINPRPPATFELHERDGGLFSAHLQACHGHLPGNKAVFDGQIHAHMILYARRTLHVPLQMKWPSWSADRPQSGCKITFAEPVCTIKANGHEQAKVKKLLYERRFALEAELLRWQDAA
jgi:predicted ATP-grasp superfamily ATP-dependent carboligase